MPALVPTEWVGEVVWLGLCPDRAAGIETRPQDRLVLTFAGIDGDAHAGLVRPACARVRRQYARRTPLRNTRQVSIVSAEELAELGAVLGLVEPVRPEWLGANVVLQGLPASSRLPPSSRLVFEQGPGLVVDLENGPCKLPAEAIEARHPGHGRAFVRKARGRRGAVAWVEREGTIGLGARCRLHVPERSLEGSIGPQAQARTMRMVSST